MNHSLTVAFLLLLFGVGCSPDTVGDTPDDLAGKQDLLAEKQDELRQLQVEIADLQTEIEELDPNARKRALVTTMTVEPSDFDHFVEIQGTVQTDDMVNVSSEVGGQIIDLRVQEGQNITKGAVIARLDLEGVKKQIAEVETSLELAREVYERQKRLWEQNIGSELQYLEAENSVNRLEKTLETLEFQYQKSTVYAPISGVVDRVIQRAGEMAGPGMPIVQILNTREVKVVADVPENYIRSVKKGEMVDVLFPALAEERRARVSEVGRTINPGNRTFNIEVELNNPSGLLKPNLLATVLINDYSESDVIVVPIELVQQEVGGKSYVFILTEGENGPEARKAYVKTGRSYEGEIVITSGLEGDETLVVQGARSLATGDLVSVATASN